MNGQKSIPLFLLIIAALIAASCNSSPAATQATLPPPTSPAVVPTKSPPQPAPSPTIVPPTHTIRPTATVGPPTGTPAKMPTITPSTLPLAQAGPYFPGKRQFTFPYAGRADGKLKITVWYPAQKPEGFTGTVAKDASPDRTSAPYPLLLSSTRIGNEFSAHMATYGFVAAGVDGQATNPGDVWGDWLINYPQEILAMLDYLASNPPEELKELIDAEHSGAYGYSFDGYNALALGGARIDPEFYLQQCAGAGSHQPPLEEWWIRYICAPYDDWDGFVAHTGKAITDSSDGLWQPLTDARIRAVMPMAPEGAWIFGESGLAAVDRPILIIGAADDDINYYRLEAAPIFEHLVVPERRMISFLGQGHMMLFDVEPKARMLHFAAAFFGYYLQGRSEYVEYFSEDFIAQYTDLVWGVVPTR